MELDSLLLSDKVEEIEENDPVPPPSLSTEIKKTISNIYSFKKRKRNMTLSIIKSKSESSLLDIQKLQDIFFYEKNKKNNSSHNSILKNKNKKTNDNKKRISNYKSINNNKNIIRNVNNNIIFNNINICDNYLSKNVKINLNNNFKNMKTNHAKFQKNYFLKSTNRNKNININTSIHYNPTNFKDNVNLVVNKINSNKQFINKLFLKKKINNTYSSYNTSKCLKSKKVIINEKINKIDENIDKRKITEVSQRKIKPKMLLLNTNINLNIKPYIKKKPEISKLYDSVRNSMKRYSLQLCDFSFNKKRPLILNVNLQKHNYFIPSLKISQLQKIIKSDGILHILRFLDYYDIINLFRTKNKKMIILINKTLAHAYYIPIKNYLLKYNDNLELLKCTIVKSQIKDSLNINLIINIRFLNCILSNNNKKQKIMQPLSFQFMYLYNYYPKIKPRKELITKEEYEKILKTKKSKIYDSYTFDLYPENYFINNPVHNSQIFITKELPIKEKDNNNIAYVQPILPFLVNDKGIINLELYSTDNGFVDPKSIKIKIKSYILKNYINILHEKKITNMRISEYEQVCAYWKNINLHELNIQVKAYVNLLFGPYFEIINITFENIGVYIFKASLKAVKIGEINKKKKIGVNIKIKEKHEYVENEIRKNNLLFEKRDVLELRVGDELLYYFCTK